MGTGIGTALKPIVFNFLDRIGRPFGFQITDTERFPLDFEKEDIEIIRAVRPYTMTSPERIYALIQSVRYIVKNDIPGSIVECGVWKGGSMMAIAMALLRFGCTEKQLFLFDTFEGMPVPTAVDVDLKRGEGALGYSALWKNNPNGSAWCYASLDEVKAALYGVGYDSQKIHFVKGKVEETLPAHAPETISLLRLDTDFYESTRHELVHLFPRLSRGGGLILDDYGHWQGARKATDEYFAQNDTKMLLNRIDYTGRIGVKT